MCNVGDTLAIATIWDSTTGRFCLRAHHGRTCHSYKHVQGLYAHGTLADHALSMPQRPDLLLADPEQSGHTRDCQALSRCLGCLIILLQPEIVLPLHHGPWCVCHRWLSELSQTEVLVMTPEVLLHVLAHGAFTVRQA